MKIALLGYGKMGYEIEQIAISRGHKIVIKYNGKTAIDISKCDIAIDFSLPQTAVQNISLCLKNNIPVVSGTTGWIDQYKQVEALCKELNGSFIYSSNFSLGVNLFFELNKKLATMMKYFSQYTTSIEEIHHTQKIDAPSGTAITLANDIIAHSNKKNWKLDSKSTNTNINIEAIRTPDVPGTHTVSYESEMDSINITHKAKNRKAFAIGAVIAAEWLVDKKGIFTMKDVLSF